MKKILTLFVALVAVVTLAACGSETTGVGYGLVHKGYVGEITLTVKDGKVTGGSIEEYYLPANLANVTSFVKDTEPKPEDVVQTGAAAWSAKYFVVDDLKFTANVVVDGTTYTTTYSASGIANIVEWVKVEVNAKKYVDAVKADKVFLANADGSKHATYKTFYEVRDNISGVNAFKKSTTGYWDTTDGKTPQPNVTSGAQLGWVKNCEATINALIGTAPSDSAVINNDGPKVSDNNTNGKSWTLDNVNTGSTWTDFKTYYDVAVRAFNNAK